MSELKPVNVAETIRWVAVDWGSTHLRVYALDKNNQLLDEKTSSDGMSGLTPTLFETVLLKLIDDWLPVEKISVIACGMVGARQGWQEAPYLQTPCSTTSVQHMTQVSTNDPRIDVNILAGVSQASPADIMRGEETQIAGLLASLESDDTSETNAFTTVCLPGTHSKWVTLNGETIRQFATYMTGEVFSLLNQQSMLRHTVASSDWDNAAFLEGVAASFEKPQDLLSNCFRLRASDLLEGFPADSARSRLSGLVIGAELAGAAPFWSGKTVALIGEPTLSQRYSEALASLGVSTEIFDPKQLTLLGLTRAYQANHS